MKTRAAAPTMSTVKDQSSSRKPKPTAVNTKKNRIATIDHDAPNKPESPKTFHLTLKGRWASEPPIPTFPPSSKTSSGIRKNSKTQKPSKPTAALHEALERSHEELEMPGRRRSSLKPNPRKGSAGKVSPKNVHFDQQPVPKMKNVAQDKGRDQLGNRSLNEKRKEMELRQQRALLQPKRLVATPESQLEGAVPESPPRGVKRGFQPVEIDGEERSASAKQRKVIKEAKIDWPKAMKECDDLLASMLRNPRPISINDISACFHRLQVNTGAWAKAHFNYSVPAGTAAYEAWPFHELSTTYLPLMLTTQYIADGSQYGWKRFFTNGARRFCLVYGVVGEYVKHHIFGHTAFGFSDEEVNELMKIEKTYIHDDAWIRGQKRGQKMKEFWAAMPKAEREREGTKQIKCLVDGIFEVVKPLMPESVFVYNKDRKKWCEKNDALARMHKAEMNRQLVDIVKQCVGLHWAMRWTGAEKGGAIVRIPQGERGVELVDRMPMTPANTEMMKATAHHGGEDQEKRALKIKMFCWGRAEAYKCVGKDQDELAYIEETYKKAHGLDRRGHGRSKKDADEKFDWEVVDDWWWRYTKTHVNPDPPRTVKETEARERSWHNDEARKERFRAPFATMSQWLNHHAVYVEWEPKEPEFHFSKKVKDMDLEDLSGKTEAEMQADKDYGLPIPKFERLSLRQAVAQARKDKKHVAGDKIRGAWTHLNQNWWKYETPFALAGLAGLSLTTLALWLRLRRGYTWSGSFHQAVDLSYGRAFRLARKAGSKTKHAATFGKEALVDVVDLMGKMLGETASDVAHAVVNAKRSLQEREKSEYADTVSMQNLNPGQA